MFYDQYIGLAITESLKVKVLRQDKRLFLSHVTFCVQGLIEQLSIVQALQSFSHVFCSPQCNFSIFWSKMDAPISTMIFAFYASGRRQMALKDTPFAFKGMFWKLHAAFLSAPVVHNLVTSLAQMQEDTEHNFLSPSISMYPNKIQDSITEERIGRILVGS